MTPEQKQQLSYDTMHAELERLIADQPRINAETRKLMAEAKHLRISFFIAPTLAAAALIVATGTIVKLFF